MSHARDVTMESTLHPEDISRFSLESARQFPIVPLGIAVSFSAHGWRRRSLSTSGALGAVVIAFVMMAVPLRVFGVGCLVFYLIGSRATKVGKKLKNELEAGHEAEGNRNVWQVGLHLLMHWSTIKMTYM